VKFWEDLKWKWETGKFCKTQAYLLLNRIKEKKELELLVMGGMSYDDIHTRRVLEQHIYAALCYLKERRDA
jgi:uncharacterized protein (UPF0371 family)